MGLGNKKLWEAWPKTSGKVSQQQLRVKGCVLESCEVPSGSVASEGQESAFETELSVSEKNSRARHKIEEFLDAGSGGWQRALQAENSVGGVAGHGRKWRTLSESNSDGQGHKTRGLA